MDIEELSAIEEIKTVKAKYFYAVDTKDWDLLASLFSPSATMDFSSEVEFADDGGAGVVESASWTFTGGQAFAHWVEKACENVVTVHNGHDPIVTLAGPRSASAIWPLSDRLETRDQIFLGFGHYHDEYVHASAGWLIERTVLKRLVGIKQVRDVAHVPGGSPVHW